MTGAWAGAFFAQILLAASVTNPVQGSVVVVTESGVPAYAEAVDGLTHGLGAQLARVVDIRAANAANDLARSLEAKETRVVVAVGSRALAELQTRRMSLPVVATMVLRGAETESAARLNLDVINLEVPLGAQLAAVRALLPRASRAGIVRNPSRARFTAEALESQGRKEGFVLIVADCDGPGRLLKVIASLKGKVDFLLPFPDPDLYNAVTIQPLVLAAIEYRLPIIGFSPAFVHAGAAAGIYPDYRALGHQTAEMALRLNRGESPAGDEFPAKLQVAVNQRVTRLLGLDLQIPSGAAVFR
jgi:ABC-type uncharacterized transport system substrate-binding protein